MKKISLIFILTLFTIRGVAQLRTDAQSIFKMYLFLGRVNVDFKEEYNKGEKKSLPTRRFLNLYKVEKLNFECLYKGLTAKEIYRDKCPCLKRTGDIASVK